MHRETNRVADLLAKNGLNSKQEMIVYYDQVPRFIRKVLVADLASIDICCNS